VRRDGGEKEDEERGEDERVWGRQGGKHEEMEERKKDEN
jgi:hypothetical protein